MATDMAQKQQIGPPKASSNPNTSRITAENLARLAKNNGRCGDIHPLTGYVCVTQPHDAETMHMAVQIGGPHDGKVYSEWQ